VAHQKLSFRPVRARVEPVCLTIVDQLHIRVIMAVHGRAGDCKLVQYSVNSYRKGRRKNPRRRIFNEPFSPPSPDSCPAAYAIASRRPRLSLGRTRKMCLEWPNAHFRHNSNELSTLVPLLLQCLLLPHFLPTFHHIISAFLACQGDHVLFKIEEKVSEKESLLCCDLVDDFLFLATNNSLW